MNAPRRPPELPPGDWRRAVYGRPIVGSERKRRPRVADKQRLLAAQGDTCLYCQLPIGAAVLRGDELVTLQRNFDHFVPYAFVSRNPGANFVIACHVCNGIKTALIFTTVEEARAYILPRREAKGYEPAWSAARRINLDAVPRARDGGSS